MKVTEAIKKARREHPELQHTTGSVFSTDGDSTIKACAIGFALVGALGLDKVEDISERYNPRFYYEFSQVWPDADDIEIFEINDKHEPGELDEVLKKLEELGI